MRLAQPSTHWHSTPHIYFSISTPLYNSNRRNWLLEPKPFHTENMDTTSVHADNSSMNYTGTPTRLHVVYIPAISWDFQTGLVFATNLFPSKTCTCTCKGTSITTTSCNDLLYSYRSTPAYLWHNFHQHTSKCIYRSTNTPLIVSSLQVFNWAQKCTYWSLLFTQQSILIIDQACGNTLPDYTTHTNICTHLVKTVFLFQTRLQVVHLSVFNSQKQQGPVP